ncbi:MAG: PfkB family carbohydrate kinase [Bryobacteraceae bacterium]
MVISMGAAGALAASQAGMWRAHAPAVPCASAVGAGDAMVAALTLSAVPNASLGDGLRLAAAAAAATVQTDGSAADLGAPRVGLRIRHGIVDHGTCTRKLSNRSTG